MKKIILTLLFAFVYILNTYGQAYSDILELKRLINDNTTNGKLKIAEILIPYFNINTPVDLEILKKNLPPEFYNPLKTYIDSNVSNFLKIQHFDSSSETRNKFLMMDTALQLINGISKRDSSKIYGLAHNITIGTISSEYQNLSLDSAIVNLSKLENTENKDTASSNSIIKTFKLHLKISLTSTSQNLKDTVALIKQQFASINEAKIAILNKVNNDPILFGKLFAVTKKGNKTAYDFKVAVKSFTNQKLPLPAIITPASISPSFGLPSQSQMIDALVIYISKRFSQEVAITFMEVLKRRARDMQLISDLFPGTIKLLMEGNTYEVPRLGGIWHNAIAEDLYNLPVNLSESKFIEQKIKTANSENYYLFKDAVQIGELARNGSSLPEIVLLYKGQMTKFNSTLVKRTFEYTNMINREFTYSQQDSSSKYWLEWHKLNNLDDNDWELLFTLIGTRYENEVFGKEGLNLHISDLKDQRWQVFKSILQKSLLLLNQFQDRNLAALSMPPGTGSAGIKLMSFWECQQQLFNVFLNENLIQSDSLLAKKVLIVNKAMKIYQMADEKNYALMLRECVKIAEEILPQRTSRLDELITKPRQLSKAAYRGEAEKINNVIEPYNDLYAALCKLDISNAKFDSDAHILINEFSVRQNVPIGVNNNNKEDMKCLTDHLFNELNDAASKKYKNLIKVRSTTAIENLMYNVISHESHNRFFATTNTSSGSMPIVLKTGEFFTDVLSANGNQQLSKVIESYAMPPRSYKLKRNTRFTVDLDAYVGIYGGVESLGSGTPDTIKRIAPVWGLSAPIGISFSWASSRETEANQQATFLRSNGKPRTLSGNNFALTISMIDIAAPLAYRWSNDAEDALPKSLRWSQLFSPGLHLRWGIKNTPLCLSTGVQYTPQLRKIYQLSSSQQAYRAYLGLFLDLPLLNIFRQ
jgi:hypothetical protein